MHNNRQLYWGQGQFLTPQHFQQQDLFHVWQQGAHWRLAHKFGWGVVTLQIRGPALEAGNFEISRCELVTRDGLLLQCGPDFIDPNAVVSPRRFQGLMDPAGTPLSVYLGLPRYHNSQSNLQTADTAPAGTTPPRFRLLAQERADLFDPAAPPCPVNVVQYNLPLFFDREEAFSTAEQAAELIKIAELVPLPAGIGARLSAGYIPPCLHIASVRSLLSRLAGLRDVMTAKGQEYEGIKRRRQDPLRLQEMQTLSRYTPLLHHLLEIGHVHPEPTYALLRQMVGELSVFAQDTSVLGAIAAAGGQKSELPPYDHERLAFCFEEAVSRVVDLVRGLDSGVEAGIALVREGRFYKAFLPPALFETERARYYLMISSSLRGDLLWQRLEKTAKISPMEDMQRLLTAAVFGLKIDLIPIPPEDLPQRGGNNTFFQIDAKDPMWARIREKQNIAVYSDLDPNDTSMKLFFVPEA
jgi:type VI secretion system ImpJ/VasE family protein